MTTAQGAEEIAHRYEDLDWIKIIPGLPRAVLGRRLLRLLVTVSIFLGLEQITCRYGAEESCGAVFLERKRR